jgi:hypothetical protein
VNGFGWEGRARHCRAVRTEHEAAELTVGFEPGITRFADPEAEADAKLARDILEVLDVLEILEIDEAVESGSTAAVLELMRSSGVSSILVESRESGLRLTLEGDAADLADRLLVARS